MRRIYHGSMTVFSALSFMLVASFLFALLEFARVQCLATVAQQKATLSLEAVASEYQPQLWEEYRILGLDGAYGGQEFSVEHVKDRLATRLSKNLASTEAGLDILSMGLKDINLNSYQMLTNGDGTVFLQCVAGYMKENLPEAVAQKIYQQYQENKEVEESGSKEDCVSNAQNAIEEARKKQQEEQEADEGGTDIEPSRQETEDGESEKQENPIELILQMKQNAVLGMVTDVGQLSNLKLSSTDNVESRKLISGNAEADPDVGWYEKVLVIEYLDSYFSNFIQPATDHGLAYELEYVLGGGETDRDNLEFVVKRLLLMREAANVAHILADEKKMAAAQESALVLAGFTGNAAVIKVVQIGIVAAWAYMESVLDVRALLAGDKIAADKKQQGSGRSQLGKFLSCFESGCKAIDCTNGLSYQDYLKGFLILEKEKTLAFRMMNVMEQTVRQNTDQEYFRMDHVICRLDYEVTYQGSAAVFKIIRSRKKVTTVSVKK